MYRPKEININTSTAQCPIVLTVTQRKCKSHRKVNGPLKLRRALRQGPAWQRAKGGTYQTKRKANAEAVCLLLSLTSLRNRKRVAGREKSQKWEEMTERKPSRKHGFYLHCTLFALQGGVLGRLSLKKSLTGSLSPAFQRHHSASAAKNLGAQSGATGVHRLRTILEGVGRKPGFLGLNSKVDGVL